MDDVLHGHKELGDVSGEALEGVVSKIEIIEPELARKVRRSGLEDSEETIEGQEDEDVLLRVVPSALLLVGQETLDDLGDQRVLGVSDKEGIKKDSINLSVTVEDENLGRAGQFGVRERGDKVGGLSCLVDAVGEESDNRGRILLVLGLSMEDLEEPSQTFHRQLFLFPLPADLGCLLNSCSISQLVLHVLITSKRKPQKRRSGPSKYKKRKKKRTAAKIKH